MSKYIDIYFDMDGTLATFKNAEKYEDFFTPGFFENLTPQRNILNGAKKLFEMEKEQKIRIYILSSIIKGHKTAKTEKNKWLDTYFPELPKSRRIYSIVGENKANYIRDINRAILIDDFGPLVDNFINAGGVAIKVSRDACDMVYEQLQMKHALYISPDDSDAHIKNYTLAVKKYCFYDEKGNSNNNAK